MRYLLADGQYAQPSAAKLSRALVCLFNRAIKAVAPIEESPMMRPFIEARLLFLPPVIAAGLVGLPAFAQEAAQAPSPAATVQTERGT
jgi:hypothetical protein